MLNMFVFLYIFLFFTCFIPKLLCMTYYKLLSFKTMLFFSYRLFKAFLLLDVKVI